MIPSRPSPFTREALADKVVAGVYIAARDGSVDMFTVYEANVSGWTLSTRTLPAEEIQKLYPGATSSHFLRAVKLRNDRHWPNQVRIA